MLASISSTAEVVVIVVALGVVGLGLWFLKSSIKVVQQGSVGVVKRLGEFKSVRQPGVSVLVPGIDKMEKVDIREFPRPATASR